MSTPGEASKSDDRVANRGEIRHRHERDFHDAKIKKDILKVLFFTLFLIVLAAVSVSDGTVVKPATNLSSPVSK